MKTISTLTLALGALLLVSTSCGKDRWPNCVKAKGDVVTEIREEGDFDVIHLEGSGDVYIYHTDDKGTPRIEVETHENIMDRIETAVKNGELTLSSKCIRNVDKLNFYVYVDDLSEVTISGSGDVKTMEARESTNLHLSISGSGDMNYETTSEDVDVSISGSGDVKLTGSTSYLEIGINGSGDVSGFDFPTEDCDIDISGSGDCSVDVSGNLDIRISGSGDVVYEGTPTGVNVSTSGSGEVSKR